MKHARFVCLFLYAATSSFVAQSQTPVYAQNGTRVVRQNLT